VKEVARIRYPQSPAASTTRSPTSTPTVARSTSRR
jgi:hypothetical protein